MALVELAADSEILEYLERPGLFLAYYSTPECRVCKSLRPKVEAVLESHEVPGVYVDVSKLTQEAGQRLIFSVPTMILFLDGREVQRFGRNISLYDLDALISRITSMMQDEPPASA